MALPYVEYEKNIIDEGLETGMKNLTQERIDKALAKVLDGETGAKLKAYVDTCVHCGLCSDACHMYLSTKRDPKLTPAGKVKRSISILVNNRGKITPEIIKQVSIVASTECNLCKRCVHYCPFGIDIAYMMTVVRRICHLCGVTPLYIQDTAHSHSVTQNQMWVKEEEWIDTLQWQEEDAREEIPDCRIPLDKEGADFMYSVIGPEPKFLAQLLYQTAIIFNAAGLNWTMPSFPGWDNSDMAMFTGDSEIMGRNKRFHFEAAQRLKVKRIVMGECGHAFRSVWDMGNRWLGWGMPPVPIVHAIEFYYDLLKSGKIKVKEKYKKSVTLHDPCNTIRGMGLHEKARYVVNELCENFIEMHPNREHNYCCNAGGGVINCGPPFKKKRVATNRIKAQQIKDTGAEILITPCHNCHSGMEDIIGDYGVDMHVKFINDIMYEVMEKPEIE